MVVNVTYLDLLSIAIGVRFRLHCRSPMTTVNDPITSVVSRSDFLSAREMVRGPTPWHSTCYLCAVQSLRQVRMIFGGPNLYRGSPIAIAVLIQWRSTYLPLTFVRRSITHLTGKSRNRMDDPRNELHAKQQPEAWKLTHKSPSCHRTTICYSTAPGTINFSTPPSPSSLRTCSLRAGSLVFLCQS